MLCSAFPGKAVSSLSFQTCCSDWQLLGAQGRSLQQGGQGAGAAAGSGCASRPVTSGRSLGPSGPVVPAVLTGLTPTHLTASLLLNLRAWPALKRWDRVDPGWLQEALTSQGSFGASGLEAS